MQSTSENNSYKKKTKTVLIIIAILMVIRLCLPSIILHFVNKKLANLDGYYGHVDDIDLAIYRGAYVINDIYIKKVDEPSKKFTDFFHCPEIDLSIEWEALFKGKIVGEVEFEEPTLKYTLNETIGKKAQKDTTNFIQLVKDFLPLRINRFTVNKAQIHYIDQGRSPQVDLWMSNVYLDGRGLTNTPQQGVILPASLSMKGNLYDGNINVEVKLDPLNDLPTFDLNGKLTETNLTNLNEFFKAYGNFDLKKGSMAIYTEFAAKKNNFVGYIKPLVKDLDIVQFNKEEGTIPQLAWEAFVGSIAEIFQNQRKDQLASKIPIEGKFTNPNVDTFDAIIAILKNAFIKALEPAIENSVNFYNISKEEKTKKEDKKGLFKQLLKSAKK